MYINLEYYPDLKEELIGAGAKDITNNTKVLMSQDEKSIWAIDGKGKLWAKGYNKYGRLGLGFTDEYINKFISPNDDIYVDFNCTGNTFFVIEKVTSLHDKYNYYIKMAGENIDNRYIKGNYTKDLVYININKFKRIKVTDKHWLYIPRPVNSYEAVIDFNNMMLIGLDLNTQILHPFILTEIMLTNIPVIEYNPGDPDIPYEPWDPDHPDLPNQGSGSDTSPEPGYGDFDKIRLLTYTHKMLFRVVEGIRYYLWINISKYENEKFKPAPNGVDTNKDGVPDTWLAIGVDTNGDEIPDTFYLHGYDLNDNGINEYLPFGGFDVSGNGVPTEFPCGTVDTDGDGKIDLKPATSFDINKDGIDDAFVFIGKDNDENGTPDEFPIGNIILNNKVTLYPSVGRDTNGDGRPDIFYFRLDKSVLDKFNDKVVRIDTDGDNYEETFLYEGKDTNGNNINDKWNFIGKDINKDGIPDLFYPGGVDSNGDGIPDHWPSISIDLDSDDIPDVWHFLPIDLNKNGKFDLYPVGRDTNNDGLMDDFPYIGLDNNEDGIIDEYIPVEYDNNGDSTVETWPDVAYSINDPNRPKEPAEPDIQDPILPPSIQNQYYLVYKGIRLYTSINSVQYWLTYRWNNYITSKVKVEQIEIVATETNLSKNTQYIVHAAIKPISANNKQVKWEVDNNTYATIDKDTGVITTKDKEGIFRVRATSKDNPNVFIEKEFTVIP